MTYPQALRYLNSLTNYETKNGYAYKEAFKLERFRNFLLSLGNPQDSLRCIHVAGSKGKGSTCALTAYILKEAGYKVGLYTSPHLCDFRERIRILTPPPATAPRTRRLKQIREIDFEGMISKAQLARLVDSLSIEVASHNKNSIYGRLTFFEVYTALAFLYFQKKKVDLAVFETGLGGRLDATNTLNPLVCVITPISYEHTQILGNTLAQIAGQKAGIIKGRRIAVPEVRNLAIPSRQLVVISAPQQRQAAEVIRRRCQEVGAKLYEVAKDITYRETKVGFSVKGIFCEYENLKIKLLGRHQLVNSACAIGAVEALKFYNIEVSAASIRKGLRRAVWPGRCEIVARRPLVVLDGAQNLASAEALKKTIKENFKYRKLALVLGISQDKDLRGICNRLKSLAEAVILTKALSARAAEPQNLARNFSDKKRYITKSVKEALLKARAITQKKDLILVSGSLFVAGEARGLLVRK